MAEISGNLRLFLIIATLVVIGLAIFYKAFLYIVDKFFVNEFTWLLQKTIFKSYLIFKSIVIGILLVYFYIVVYSIIFTPYWFYGVLIFGCLLYLVLKVKKLKSEGKFNFKEDFEFQKYNTNVEYYNKQDEGYRRKSYQTIIEKIQRSSLDEISNEFLKKHLIENFLPNIENVLTFEFYDTSLYHALSNHSTISLFYRKYMKNLSEIISRINIETDNLLLIDNDYQFVVAILLNVRIREFDDYQGLHYDTSLVDSEIEKYLNSHKEKFDIEKSLLVINQSIENLNLAFDNTEFKVLFSEQMDVLEEIKEKINSFQNNKNFKYQLSGNCTIKDLSDNLIGYLQSIDHIKLSAQNISDIQEFAKRRFRNKANRQPIPKGGEYEDVNFFIKNREEFYKALRKVIKDFNLEKKKIAITVFEEFPNIENELKTIENRL